MAGHVVEKRPGVWEMRVYMGRDPLTGRKLWETGTVAATGKKEAQLACDAFAIEVKGAPAGARAMTVGDLLERWYQHGVSRRLWSPAVELLHRRQIDTTFKPLHDVRLADVDAMFLDDFYDALRTRGSARKGPLSVATVRRRAGILSLAFDQGVRWKKATGLTSNPCKEAQPGKLKKRKQTPPDHEQVKALLREAGERDKELLTYLFLDAEAGARRGEVAALRLTDFTTDAVQITRALTVGLATPENAAFFAGHYWPSRWSRGNVQTALIEKEPKNEESVRTVALCPATLALVWAQAALCAERLRKAGREYPADGFLFPAPGDGLRPLRSDTWTDRFTTLRDDLGLTGVRLHDLRHYVATTLLNAGVDLATVAGRLGHGGGGKTTLAIYGHPSKVVDRASSDLMATLIGEVLEDEGVGRGNVIPIRPKAATP